MSFDQLNAARDQALEANARLQERALDTAKANTSAFFDIYSKGLQVRTAEDVKSFWTDVAKVARENTERVVSLFQDNSQSAVNLANAGLKTAQDAVNTGTTKASAKR